MKTIEKHTNEFQQQAHMTSALIAATNKLSDAARALATLTGAKENTRKPATFRRGLSRIEAAQYIGVGSTKFDQLVSDEKMPRPKTIGGRRVWDVFELDEFFEGLGSQTAMPATVNQWD